MYVYLISHTEGFIPLYMTSDNSMYLLEAVKPLDRLAFSWEVVVLVVRMQLLLLVLCCNNLQPPILS